MGDLDLTSLMPGPWEVPLDLWAFLVRFGREHRQLSQQAVAEAAGVRQQTISKLEAGSLCPHDSLKAGVARALVVPTGDLFPWPVEPLQGPRRG